MTKGEIQYYCDAHLSILQLHIQEVKVSENPELLLTGGVI